MVVVFIMFLLMLGSSSNLPVVASAISEKNMISAGQGVEDDKKKYAVVVVAGQSNSVGYDESPVDYDELSKMINSRIKQLGIYGEDNLQIIPLSYSSQNLQDMRTFSNGKNEDALGTKGVHLPLANELLNYIPQDHELLIIPVAFGGTGFTTNKSNGTYNEETLKPQVEGSYSWGIDSAYYKTLKERLKYVLDLNEDNYYIGTVWNQGEADGANPTAHYREFTEMTEDFFSYFNKNYPDRVGNGEAWSKEQWFIYETVPYWYNTYEYSAGVRQIWNNYKTWSPTTYVPIDLGDNSEVYTNETNGTGKTSKILASHYGNDAFAKKVAPEVANKMIETGVLQYKGNGSEQENANGTIITKYGTKIVVDFARTPTSETALEANNYMIDGKALPAGTQILSSGNVNSVIINLTKEANSQLASNLTVGVKNVETENGELLDTSKTIMSSVMANSYDVFYASVNRNIINVNHIRDVKIAEALKKENYTLNGNPLPEGTVIRSDSDQTRIFLPIEALVELKGAVNLEVKNMVGVNGTPQSGIFTALLTLDVK